ncbi:DUF4386 family protein [Anaerolineae bacterium CFX7]|nr:DUF4386 family protein [Anaerolineae bacterium CFX7]
MKAPDSSQRTYAQVAGFTFLFYIIAGISSMGLGSESQFSDLLLLFQSFSALVLGVTLFALTYKQGLALATLALTFRVVEGVQYGESAIYFAAASLLFAWLLLRGRMIPVPLAWLGVIASALLVVILPFQLAGLFGGAMLWSSSGTWLVWLPMLVFEVVLALWLLIKGVHVESRKLVASTQLGS